MPCYRIYVEVPDVHVMRLRGYASEFEQAVIACNALIAGRPMPITVRADTAAQGVITGVPVWVRYRPGRHRAMMITENVSLEEARNQEAAVAASITSSTVVAA